jgi:hypothetical protein
MLLLTGAAGASSIASRGGKGTGSSQKTLELRQRMEAVPLSFAEAQIADGPPPSATLRAEAVLTPHHVGPGEIAEPLAVE